MTQTPRFKRAYQALITAYFDGSLKKGDCTACAVGNICKEASEELKIDGSIWQHLFVTSYIHGSMFAGPDEIIVNHEIHPMYRYYNSKEKKFLAKVLVMMTEYSVKQLSEVEKTFETTSKIRFKDYPDYSEKEVLEDQYNGLAAVVDLLLSFDNLEDTGEKSKLKAHPKLATL